MKIKPKGTHVLGICDCGFSRRFELIKDFKIPSEELTCYQLNETFCCPKCLKKYNQIKALQQGNELKGWITYGMILFILFFILGYPVVKGMLKE